MFSSMPKNLSCFSIQLALKLQNNYLNLKQIQQIQSQLITNGHLNSNPLLTTFLSSCYRSQKPQYGLQVLQNLQNRNLSLWDSMIRVSLQSGFCSEFFGLYGDMLRNGLIPSKSTFSIILQSCASLVAIQLGESFHCQLIKIGFEYDLILQTGLLDFYAKIGDLVSAERMFDEMSEKDVVSNNAMISALSKNGRVEEARRLFDSMPEQNSASWNSMISCYCKFGDIGSARLMFDCNPVKDLVSWNAIIDGYCKSNQIIDAEKLFVKMGSAKNSITWNTMISAYVGCGEFVKAISTFKQMQFENVKPTGVTMASLLCACAHIGALDMGEWIHGYIRRMNLKIDVVLGNALIDMYCKCGCIDSALSVFHGLPIKNIYCWNSIIVGLGMNGFGEKAIDGFKHMVKKGIKPDGITFIGLLSGCSHSGLVVTGKRYFSQMLEIYRIEPGIEHYGCMVDLLGRAGFLNDALELIRTMLMKPNALVWGSLLRACQIHKDKKLSEHVTQKLLELDPSDGGNYVFLSNFYASLNQWDDVNICRKLMIQKGIRKTPGCSSIEVDKIAYEFVAGDTSHPQFAQIKLFLDQMTKKLQGYGYGYGIDSSSPCSMI